MMFVSRNVSSIGLACSLFIASTANGQTYAPGQKPSVNEIVHVAVEELPAPQTRTTIGIGEDVSCSIDESSWSDPDDQINGSKKTTVYDKMGQVKWSASGAGTVYPIYSTSTTLTADLVSADDTVTVEASIVDAGLFALDYPPGGGALVKVLVMQVKVPTSMNAAFGKDGEAGTKGNPPSWMRALAAFDVQVLPTNVSFNKAAFRFNFPKDQEITLPSGAKFGTKAGTYAWGVRTNKIVVNYLEDIVDSGVFKTSDMIDANKMAKNVSWSVNFPAEFEGPKGTWNSFAPNFSHDFAADGTALTVTPGVTAANGAQKGNAMGPWFSIP
jgi:hypothetical protein